MTNSNSNSYAYLSCSFNHNIFNNIQELINREFEPKQAAIIIQKLQTDQLTSLNDPISPELFSAFKLLKFSSKISILSTQLWSLQEEFNTISNHFNRIDYDEISRLETAEREKVEGIIRKLAEEGDNINEQYGEQFTDKILNHIDHFQDEAEKVYSDYIHNRYKFYQIALKTVKEIAEQNNITILLDDRDFIFNCRNMDDLNSYADYFNLYSCFKNMDKRTDYDWTNYQMSYGDNGIMKFYVISMTHLLLHSATKNAMNNSQEVNNSLFSEAGIKKYSKEIYKRAESDLRTLLEEPGFKPANIPELPIEKSMKNILKQMHKLLADFNHAKLPSSHEISVSDASNLSNLIPKTGPSKALKVKKKNVA